MVTKHDDKLTAGDGTADELEMPSYERDHNKRRREMDDADLLLNMNRRCSSIASPTAKRRMLFDDDDGDEYPTRAVPRAKMRSFEDDDSERRETASTAIAAAAVPKIGTNSDIRLHHAPANTDALESLQRLMEYSCARNRLALSSFHHSNRHHILPMRPPRHPYYKLTPSSQVTNSLHPSTFAAAAAAAAVAPFPLFVGADPRCLIPLSSRIGDSFANRSRFFDNVPLLPTTRLPHSHTYQLQQAATQRFLLTHQDDDRSAPKRAIESLSDSVQFGAAAATSMQQIPVSSSPSFPSGKKRRTTSESMDPQPPSNTRLLLYVPQDHGNLNDHQIYLRMQIEYFQATQDDILSLTRGKNKPIVLQQVGIRCRHCCHVPVGQRKKGSTYFPSALMGIYQAAQNLSVEHLQSGMCPELPPEIKHHFATFVSKKPGASGGGKKYWADSGAKLGLVDTEDGIRFAATLGRRARKKPNC